MDYIANYNKYYVYLELNMTPEQYLNKINVDKTAAEIRSTLAAAYSFSNTKKRHSKHSVNDF